MVLSVDKQIEGYPAPPNPRLLEDRIIKLGGEKTESSSRISSASSSTDSEYQNKVLVATKSV